MLMLQNLKEQEKSEGDSSQKQSKISQDKKITSAFINRKQQAILHVFGVTFSGGICFLRKQPGLPGNCEDF